MELRSRGIVTLDYEIDFPRASEVELTLYSDGARRFPRILGQSGLWGVIRRPGIVDIQGTDYEDVLDSLSLERLNDDALRSLSRTFAWCRLELEASTASGKGFTPGSFLNVDPILTLMAYHVLNWAVPWREIEQFFSNFLGTKGGRDSLLTILSPGHSHVFAGSQKGPIAASVALEARNESERQSRMRRAIELKLINHAFRSSQDQGNRMVRALRLCRLASEAEETRRRLQDEYLLAHARTNAKRQLLISQLQPLF